MRKTCVALSLVFALLCSVVPAQAMTLTDDPATMVPLSMALTQVCKSNGMGYWETFWTITAFSVLKEIADQAGENDFNSGHIGLNLAGMTMSWFLFNF